MPHPPYAEAQGARTLLEEIAAAGIDLDAVTAELEDDGVKRFAKSYDDMIASITQSAPAFSRPDDRQFRLLHRDREEIGWEWQRPGQLGRSRLKYRRRGRDALHSTHSKEYQ